MSWTPGVHRPSEGTESPFLSFQGTPPSLKPTKLYLGGDAGSRLESDLAPLPGGRAAISGHKYDTKRCDPSKHLQVRAGRLESCVRSARGTSVPGWCPALLSKRGRLQHCPLLVLSEKASRDSSRLMRSLGYDKHCCKLHSCVMTSFTQDLGSLFEGALLRRVLSVLATNNEGGLRRHNEH